MRKILENSFTMGLWVLWFSGVVAFFRHPIDGHSLLNLAWRGPAIALVAFVALLALSRVFRSKGPKWQQKSTHEELVGWNSETRERVQWEKEVELLFLDSGLRCEPVSATRLEVSRLG